MFKKLLSIWRKWILNVSFGFADQVLLSGANFFFNVLLVRWLLPREYGVFAVAFSIFIFSSGFQNALILQPASVIGAAYYQESLSRYFGIVTLINGVLTCGFSIIFLLIALIMALCHHYLAFSFMGLSIATPFILFFWLFRQFCYIKTRPDLAWRASLLYAFFLIGGTFTLENYSFVSAFNAFTIMAFSSFLSTVFFWRYLGIDGIWVCINQRSGRVNNILNEHWRYGRWVVGSAFSSWFSTVSYLPLVGFLVGIQQAGVFRAIQNLMLPLERLLSVFSLLLIPWISKNRSLKGDGYVKKRLFTLMMINLFLASVFGLFLIIYGNRFAKLLYGSHYVVSFTWLLPYFVIITVISVLVQVLGIGLKILERPDVIFWAENISTVLTLTFGLYLVAAFELRGAAIGLLISTITMFISLSYFLFKHFRRSKSAQIS